MHPPTHTPLCRHVFMDMQTGIYPWFRLACGSNTTTLWVLPSTQLVCIHQGNTEACTLLPFSCPSTPLFVQQGATVVSNTPPCLGQGCWGPVGGCGWISDVDIGIRGLHLCCWGQEGGRVGKLKIWTAATAQLPFAPCLWVLRIETTTNLKSLCPKVVQDQCLGCSYSAGQTCLQVCKQAGQEELRETEVMVVTGPSEPQVGAQWGCLGSRWKKLLRDLGKVYSHNEGITALRK